MMYVNKKGLRFFVFVAVCSLCMPVRLHANNDETLRKVLGIVGACLMAHGVVKVVSHPIKGAVKGAASIIVGAVVGIGGICSDIILSRIQQRMWQESPNQRVGQQIGQVFNAGKQFLTEAADTHEAAQSLLRDGANDLSLGRFCTGTGKMYAGVYHGIRAECIRTLIQCDE